MASTTMHTPPTTAGYPAYPDGQSQQQSRSIRKGRKGKKSQSAYASDSGTQQAPKATAASDTNEPSQRRRQKQQNQKITDSPIPGLDGAMSPRPVTAHTTNPPAPITTPLKQAYAGPTFHASPAPSTLPKPKFFSKSVSSSTPSSLQARLEADKGKNQTPSPESDSQAYLAPRSSQPTPTAREESPLDVFFNADRAEKARQQSSDPLSPQSTFRTTPRHASSSSHPTPSTFPRSARSTHVTRPGNTTSNKEMFLMDVDGNVDAGDDREEYQSSDFDAQRPSGTPFADKLRGFNPNPKSNGGPASMPQRPPSSQLHQQPQQPPQLKRNMQSDDLFRHTQSQALKRLLQVQPGSDAPAQPRQSIEESSISPLTQGSGPGQPVEQQPDHQQARQVSAPVELAAADVEWPVGAGNEGPHLEGPTPSLAHAGNKHPSQNYRSNRYPHDHQSLQNQPPPQQHPLQQQHHPTQFHQQYPPQPRHHLQPQPSPYQSQTLPRPHPRQAHPYQSPNHSYSQIYGTPQPQHQDQQQQKSQFADMFSLNQPDRDRHGQWRQDTRREYEHQLELLQHQTRQLPQHQPRDVSAMENDLKRVLNLS